MAYFVCVICMCGMCVKVMCSNISNINNSNINSSSNDNGSNIINNVYITMTKAMTTMCVCERKVKEEEMAIVMTS